MDLRSILRFGRISRPITAHEIVSLSNSIVSSSRIWDVLKWKLVSVLPIFTFHKFVFTLHGKKKQRPPPTHYPLPRDYPSCKHSLRVGSTWRWSFQSSTSFDGTLGPFLLFHHVSSMAIKQERTIPAARIQKTPAKLFMSRAPPFCFVSTEEYRSHWPLLGHHLCFRMSMSPFCWSSRILGVKHTIMCYYRHAYCVSPQHIH